MRTIIFHRGGSDVSISMLTGRLLAQKIDVSEMTPDQLVETMGLSIQWMREGARPKGRKFNAAVENQGSRTTEARRARLVKDIKLSERVAEYAMHMSNYTTAKRAARSKARLEALNKMLQEEGH